MKWIQSRVEAFVPEQNQVVLDDGGRVSYRMLVAAPGLELHLDGVEGLRDGLGRNGVTSNYLFEYAPYTWQCVRDLHQGRALFTQPPMPIKCAGAPQKALYLSCDHWRRHHRLSNIDVQFHNAGGVQEAGQRLATSQECTRVARVGAVACHHLHDRTERAQLC